MKLRRSLGGKAYSISARRRAVSNNSYCSLFLHLLFFEFTGVVALIVCCENSFLHLLEQNFLLERPQKAIPHFGQCLSVIENPGLTPESSDKQKRLHYKLIRH